MFKAKRPVMAFVALALVAILSGGRVAARTVRVSSGAGLAAAIAAADVDVALITTVSMYVAVQNSRYNAASVNL